MDLPVNWSHWEKGISSKNYDTGSGKKKIKSCRQQEFIILGTSDIPQFRPFLTRFTPKLYSLPSSRREMLWKLGKDHQGWQKDLLMYRVGSQDLPAETGHCLLLLLALGTPAGPGVSTLSPLQNTLC